MQEPVGEPLLRFSIFWPLRIDTKLYWEWAQCNDVDPACKLSERSILRSILKTGGLLLSEYEKAPCNCSDNTFSDEFGDNHLARDLLLQISRFRQPHSFQIRTGGFGHRANFKCSEGLPSGAARCAQFGLKGLEGFSKGDLDFGQVMTRIQMPPSVAMGVRLRVGCTCFTRLVTHGH